jgi:hypothetical protein
MSRIRTIKPEFWADEKLAPLPPIDRLVFLGLISMADDAGRMVDSVRQLDGALFPFSDDTCGPSLDTLARLSRVRRYISESGQHLVQIEGWEKHQKVDRPAKYVLPPPPPEDPESASLSDPRENLATSSRHPRAPTYDLRPTTYDPGPEETPPVVPPGADAPQKKSTKERASSLPSGWAPNQGHAEVATEERVDLEREATKFRDHAASEGRRQLDWDAAFRNWLRKARDFQRPSQQSGDGERRDSQGRRLVQSPTKRLPPPQRPTWL